MASANSYMSKIMQMQRRHQSMGLVRPLWLALWLFPMSDGNRVVHLEVHQVVGWGNRVVHLESHQLAGAGLLVAKQLQTPLEVVAQPVHAEAAEIRNLHDTRLY